MTSITLTVTGAKALASVSGTLTSGMVGIPVTILYDDAWDGLTKNLVCRCGKWGPESGETRTVLNVGETATAAHEVMQPQMRLYLGVEGYSADGKLVIPTTWADCGMIQHGANAGADPSADPGLPVWAQLQAEMRQLQQQGITDAQIRALDGMFKVCAYIRADVSAEYAAFRAAFGITDSGELHTHQYTSSITKQAACASDGVRTYTCSCGFSYTEAIPATGHDYVDGVCSVCGEADPDYILQVTLTSISAAYSGGDVVVGTAVADLTGIDVTAYYSDGTTKVVTDYTISGTIAEGENTITVSYGGKTAAFTVKGIAEESAAVNLMTSGDLGTFSDLGTYTGYTGYYDADARTLQLSTISNATSSTAHLKITPFVEAGKTYTLFLGSENRTVHSTTTVVDYTKTSTFVRNYLETVNNGTRVQFTVPSEAVEVYFLYVTDEHADTTVTNVALYEGTYTEMP